MRIITEKYPVRIGFIHGSYFASLYNKGGDRFFIGTYHLTTEDAVILDFILKRNKDICEMILQIKAALPNTAQQIINDIIDSQIKLLFSTIQRV